MFQSIYQRTQVFITGRKCGVISKITYFRTPFLPFCILKLVASAVAAAEFCEWVQVGIDIYISHRKYHVKSHSSAVCPTAITHINHFLGLHQQNKSSESKVMFRHGTNRCQRVLEAAKLAYANKSKESITSQKLGFREFGRIVNSVLNKGKPAIPCLFDGPGGVVFCI